MNIILARDLKEKLETAQENLSGLSLANITVQENINFTGTISAGEIVQLNQGSLPLGVAGSLSFTAQIQHNYGAEGGGVLQLSQIDSDQDNLSTLTIMRSVLGPPALKASIRISALKGDGELELKGHTLNVAKALEAFTGKLVGPGEVQYAGATTVMTAAQTCEVREGVLQLSQIDSDHLSTFTIRRNDLGAFLNASIRIGTLKGDGELKLKGHTLTVVKALGGFTGEFVGPGEVKCAGKTTVILADQICELKGGVLQLSQPVRGSARRLIS